MLAEDGLTCTRCYSETVLTRPYTGVPFAGLAVTKSTQPYKSTIELDVLQNTSPMLLGLADTFVESSRPIRNSSS